MNLALDLTQDLAHGPFASLLAAMDCVALEITGVDADGTGVDAGVESAGETGDNTAGGGWTIRIVSAVPPWLESIAENDPNPSDILSVLPFLEVFLHEAVTQWRGGLFSRLQSDFWTQNDAAGEEVHLLALAAMIDGRRLIVVRSANDLYAERQRWQLYAHQTSMQLQLIERLRSELEQSAAALRAANGRLSEMSIRDSLTNLYNRRYFDSIFQAELARSVRTGEPLSLLFMDVDKFKMLNDTYGHAAGDDCLRAVARVLAETVHRASDTVARFGGEEFAVLLPATGADEALALAASLREAVRGMNFENRNSEVEPFVTASLGVYTRERDGVRTTVQMFEAVDAALYRAKREGRNRVVVG